MRSAPQPVRLPQEAPRKDTRRRKKDARIVAAENMKVRGNMDRDTNLFVQAFWVKCRDVIRPELDRAVDDLKSAGHDANVSTQEYFAGRRPPARHRPRPDAHRASQGRTAKGRTLQFHGDVAKSHPRDHRRRPPRPITTISPRSTSPVNQTRDRRLGGSSLNQS